MIEAVRRGFPKCHMKPGAIFLDLQAIDFACIIVRISGTIADLKQGDQFYVALCAIDPYLLVMTYHLHSARQNRLTLAIVRISKKIADLKRGDQFYAALCGIDPYLLAATYYLQLWAHSDL